MPRAPAEPILMSAAMSAEHMENGMSETVTLDEVWRLFRETGERFRESDERVARLEEEASRRKAEAAERLARLEEEYSRRKVEAAERLAKLDEEVRKARAETEAAMKDLSRRMGQFTNQLGELAEAMISPAVWKQFAARGIAVHGTARNVSKTINGRTIEIDLLVTNGDSLVAIEVKTKPTVRDVNEHLARLTKFKDFFPDYRERKLLGAIAGLVLDEGVARYAYRKGLFVLSHSADTVTILNDDRFRPRNW